MKLLIGGSRNFNDYELMKYHLQFLTFDKIISGGARGADKLAEKYAKENKIKFILFEANWESYGKNAGFKRNIKMIEEADFIIVFWDGKSNGTKHAIEYAKKFGKRIIIVNYLNNLKYEIYPEYLD
jgi:hypothetical protein